MKIKKLFETEIFEFLLFDLGESPIPFVLDKPSNLWYVCPDYFFESIATLSPKEKEPKYDEYLDLLNLFKTEQGQFPLDNFPDVLFPAIKKDVLNYIAQLKTTMIYKYGT